MSLKTHSLLQEHNARWVDLRFTDTLGKEHHVLPAEAMQADAFEDGKMFDGLSIRRLEGHRSLRHGAAAR